MPKCASFLAISLFFLWFYGEDRYWHFVHENSRLPRMKSGFISTSCILASKEGRETARSMLSAPVVLPHLWVGPEFQAPFLLPGRAGLTLQHISTLQVLRFVVCFSFCFPFLFCRDAAEALYMLYSFYGSSETFAIGVWHRRIVVPICSSQPALSISLTA